MYSPSVDADISENEELEFGSDSSMDDCESLSGKEDVVCGPNEGERQGEEEGEEGSDSNENSDEDKDELTRYVVLH